MKCERLYTHESVGTTLAMSETLTDAKFEAADGILLQIPGIEKNQDVKETNKIQS